MLSPTVGIDVSKNHLDVAIYGLSKSQPHRQFPYTVSGQQQILAWLHQHKVSCGHVCLEATGRYSLSIAQTLYEAGYQVSIENPARTKYFAKSLMARQKTDKADAQILAQYASIMKPRLWSPPTTLQAKVQDLKRLLEDMHTDRTRIINRLEALVPSSPASPYLKAQLEQLERQIAEVEKEIEHIVDQDESLSSQTQLLTSIVGIGKTTAIELLAEIPDWSRFTCADELVAFAGLHPEHRQSGNKAGYSRLSKQGNAHIRKTLYFPALSAMQHNPHLKTFANRLKAKGKAKMLVVVAVMRKLLVLVYALLKSGQAYDRNYQFSA